MKILVVYYSRTKHTKKVAERIAAELKAGLEEITDTKNRDGILGYLSAGKDASFKRLTDIEDVKYDPSDYDCVIVGTPIWSRNVSVPIRTYLRNNQDKFKKVAFFSTMGGSGDLRAYRDMASECGHEPLATLTLSTKEAALGDVEGKLNEFIKRFPRPSDNGGELNGPTGI